jgi:UDP-N-acetylglucosamine 2-epimerase
MIDHLDNLIDESTPSAVVVFGDANTTLAAALAAARSGTPLAHIEAGLRTGAATTEEVNRVVADQLSSLHLAASRRDLENLIDERRVSTSHFVGDLVRDLCVDFAGRRDRVEDDLALISLHRTENMAFTGLIERVLSEVTKLGLRAIFLAHPRVVDAARRAQETCHGDVDVRLSVPHRELLELLSRARLLVTDSGALQRESYYVGCRAVVVQDMPFWPSLVDGGFHVAVGPGGNLAEAIMEALLDTDAAIDDFGDPPVADAVMGRLDEWMSALEHG